MKSAGATVHAPLLRPIFTQNCLCPTLSIPDLGDAAATADGALAVEEVFGRWLGRRGTKNQLPISGNHTCAAAPGQRRWFAGRD
jgi:hypothetical protein